MKFTIMIQSNDHLPDVPRIGTLLMVPRGETEITGDQIKTLLEYEETEELPVPDSYSINNIDIGWCFIHKDTQNLKGFSLFLVNIFMI